MSAQQEVSALCDLCERPRAGWVPGSQRGLCTGCQEIPTTDPNDPALAPQCYTNGFHIISSEAWARGVRIDDLGEGMPATIYWGGSRERGCPATVETIRRAKSTGRILCVTARREDGAPLGFAHVDPTFIAETRERYEQDPETMGWLDAELAAPDEAVRIDFTLRNWGRLICKGQSSHPHAMRLVIGTMFVQPDDRPDMPF